MLNKNYEVKVYDRDGDRISQPLMKDLIDSLDTIVDMSVNIDNVAFGVTSEYIPRLAIAIASPESDPGNVISGRTLAGLLKINKVIMTNLLGTSDE